jgi:hypothetical protein
VPIYRYVLFGPLPGPRLHNLFGGSLARALDESYAPTQSLLHPLCTFLLSTVASIQPQMTEARKTPVLRER